MPALAATWTWLQWEQAGGLDGTSWEGLLFDLDGTLVDTLPLHYEAYRRVLADHALVLSWEGFMAHAPSPANQSIPGFIRVCGGNPQVLPPVLELHTRKKQVFAILMEEQRTERMPAAELFERALDAGWPVGIVTSGNRDGVERILRTQGWLHRLGVLVTGDEVEQGKPHAEPYLLGARLLGHEPAACIAFEDTLTGIEAAWRAGMRVVDVRHNRGGA